MIDFWCCELLLYNVNQPLSDWVREWHRSVIPDSSRPHGLEPTRLLCPWDFPGKSTGVGCHCLLQKWKSLSRVWLFADPMDYTTHGILQARILEWVAFPFSRGSSQPRDPALQEDSLPAEPQEKSAVCIHMTPPCETSLSSPHPALWVITEHRAELPVLSSSSPLAVRVTHITVAMSVLISQCIPPSASPLGPQIRSLRPCLFLPCTQVHWYHFSS